MSTTTQRNILILAPHCDDAEFGLGASIQRWRMRAHGSMC